MALFLAINTAGLAILPSGVVAMRAAAGSDGRRPGSSSRPGSPRVRDRGRNHGGVPAVPAASSISARSHRTPDEIAVRENAGEAADSPATPEPQAIERRRAVALRLFWLVFLALLGRHVWLAVAETPRST